LHVFLRFHPPKFSHNRFNPYFFYCCFFSLQNFNWNCLTWFNFLKIGLSWSHDLGRWLSRLPRVYFFFQFHPLILGWLRIRLHNFFRFAFYEVTPASWLGSRVWSINLSWLMWFFHLIFNCFFFFLQFHSSTLSWLRIEVYNLF
jgi:hypothetical protein